MSTIGTTLFSKIEINGQEVDIATLDAADGIYALPAGYTTANVKFTMIDNTSIPRGVFEENSYITAMTLPDAMTYIASYSFHGVDNINTTDKNAILAINPYAFDAEPTPSYIDPDLHYVGGTGNYDLYTHMETIPGLQNSYNVSPITYTSSDTAVATVNPDGIINYLAVGTTTITASFAGDTTYEADSTSFSLTVADSTPVTDPDFYFPSNIYEINSGMGSSMSMNLINNTHIDTTVHPIQWTSSSADITIDQYGYVFSSMVGATSTITATISDGTNTHTATCTVSVVATKQNPTANWVDSNLNPVYNLQLVEGNTSDQTLTFSATPNDSWSFYDPGLTGISVNTTTGEITITGASVQSSESSVSANRMEDASYYSGFASLNINVFPAGTDLTFYYEQSSVNLDNQAMTTTSPMLHDEYVGLGYTKTYASSNTSVATVDAYGTISFAGAGTTTVTATTTNGSDTHTATITVYCNYIAPYTASIHYTDELSNTYPQGYFDMTPIDWEAWKGGNRISAVVELTGPEISSLSEWVAMTDFDYTYSATQNMQFDVDSNSQLLTYQNGINTITVPFAAGVNNVQEGTDRFVLTCTYDGYNYITNEGIKFYQQGEES